MWPVSRDVNSPETDRRELLDRVEEPPWPEPGAGGRGLRFRSERETPTWNGVERANYLLPGLAGVVVIAGAIGYSIMQTEQPTPQIQEATTTDRKKLKVHTL